MQHWLPKRLNGRDINKGTFGHVLALAGSRGFEGAPILVAEAACRAGAGLVSLAVPSSITASVMARISPVVMAQGLVPPSTRTFGKDSLEAALSLSKKASVVVLGPGLGIGEEIFYFVREFITRCPVPLVVDADALTALSQEVDRGASRIQSRKAATILTPHPGEMGQLLDWKTEFVQEHRVEAITSAVKNYACVVLLKGFHTLISTTHSPLYTNTSGNPGMASGGTGDVLSGVIAALVAQDLEPLPAAAAGVFLHGMAGDIAAAAQGGASGLIAMDIIHRLPQAIAHCQAIGSTL